MTTAHSRAQKVALYLVCTLFIFFCSIGLHRSKYSEQSHLRTAVRMGDKDVHTLSSREVQSYLSLAKREDYSCSKTKPCRNGACCGASGYCGYGPTYCGQGCLSNCDATAECGQYAKIPGTKCPLNTCCSQYGFCGTTELFCDSKCQSNCVLHPPVPVGGSGLPITESRVIGYYESWSARKSCHKIAPENLPLDALTHVNFAFAYIAPGSYELTTMDSQSPSDLFQQTANLKIIKPGLFVYISVGGWTFSDNGTTTQPLFGEIAADAAKRQKFADNVVHFMRQYGFDGIDLDWEYPGAPDRGGKAGDTKNFVKLLQTLRQTFDASGSRFGLTFTAPSSYWYLRWFDLPSMLQFADWINFMTYDLHGVWDSTNPIGSIVQGHTNLTEIKLATDLLWRVKVPPSKVVLGLGFYGRSFTLRDPSCNRPGCAFSGASKPGPCTKAGGILAYYEILSILQDSGSNVVKPIHDTTAAVKYFTFQKDQWISYDDDVTFKQKVDWANSVGLGGALIWASDLDDDKYSAHAGLLGRQIASTSSISKRLKANPTQESIVQDLAGSTGQNCFAYSGKCVDLNDNKAMQAACGKSFTVVGWDDAGCGKKSCHCGKPICCPTNQAPTGCKWRGNGNGRGVSSDCNAQCFAGETNVNGIWSHWGGGFVNDGNTNKCGRGYKVFCCPNPDAGQVTKGCYYSKCGGSCPAGMTSAFQKTGSCHLGRHQQYCCPNPLEITGCHWVYGKRAQECINPVCNATEIQIDRSQYGDYQVGCSWGRKMSACCTVTLRPPTPAICSADLCRLGLCTSNIGPRGISEGRGLQFFDQTPNLNSISEIWKRQKDREYPAVLGSGYLLYIFAAAYPVVRDIYGIPNEAQVIRATFRLIAGWCLGPAIDVSRVSQGANPPGLDSLQTEHPLDLQIGARFIEVATLGRLPSSTRPPIPPVSSDFFEHYWDHPFHTLAGRPPVGSKDGLAPSSPSERFAQAFGSTHWPYPFLPTDSQINGPKGFIMNLQAPTSLTNIRSLADRAVDLDTQQAADDLLSGIRAAFAVFEYMRTPEFAVRFNAVIDQVRLQLQYIEADAAVPNLAVWWDLFIDDYLTYVEGRTRNWANSAIAAASSIYQRATSGNQQRATAASVLNVLRQWENDVDQLIQFPPRTGRMPNPGSPPGTPPGSPP